MSTQTHRSEEGLEFSLAVRTRRVKNAILVEVEGELDLATTPHLQERLGAALEDVGTEILLDLSELHFIDGTGWSAVCEAAAILHDRGQTLTIVATSPRARGLLDLVGLEPGIELVDTAEL